MQGQSLLQGGGNASALLDFYFVLILFLYYNMYMEEIKKPAEKVPNIEELRGKIDSLDKEFLSVLAKRMSLIPKVAEYKKKNSVPRIQEGREKEIMESRRKTAEELLINPNLAEKIMKLIIEDAHRIEKEIIGE